MRLAVMARDALAKFGQAKRVGVTEGASGHFAFHGLAHEARRGCPRLADLHVNDVGASGLARVRLSHDVHDNKRIDRASQGWRKGSRPSLWRPLRHRALLRAVILYAPNGRNKFRSNFYLSLSGPPTRLSYFTKKRFIEALTPAASEGLSEITHIYREILAGAAAEDCLGRGCGHAGRQA